MHCFVNETLDQVALSTIQENTEEKANSAAARKKKKQEDAAKLLAELERSEAPRRRVHSLQFLERLQNSWGTCIEQQEPEKRKKRRVTGQSRSKKQI